MRFFQPIYYVAVLQIKIVIQVWRKNEKDNYNCSW